MAQVQQEGGVERVVAVVRRGGGGRHRVPVRVLERERGAARSPGLRPRLGLHLEPQRQLIGLAP